MQMEIAKAGVVYFGIVFAIGFVLGAVRTCFVAPRVGERKAELTEAPVMLIASIAAARWAVGYFKVQHLAVDRIQMGVLALALLLIAELLTVRLVRRISIRQYFATRDPVAEGVYYVLVVLFGVMPVVVR